MKYELDKRRYWTVEELADIAKSHMELPPDVRRFHMLDMYIYPKWMMFAMSHIPQMISYNDVMGNLYYIAILTHERALETSIDDLIEMGYIVRYDEHMIGR